MCVIFLGYLILISYILTKREILSNWCYILKKSSENAIFLPHEFIYFGYSMCYRKTCFFFLFLFVCLVLSFPHPYCLIFSFLHNPVVITSQKCLHLFSSRRKTTNSHSYSTQVFRWKSTEHFYWSRLQIQQQELVC